MSQALHFLCLLPKSAQLSQMQTESVQALFSKAAGLADGEIILKPGVEGIAILLDLEDLDKVAHAFAAHKWNRDHSFTLTEFKTLCLHLVDVNDVFDFVARNYDLEEEALTLKDKKLKPPINIPAPTSLPAKPHWKQFCDEYVEMIIVVDPAQNGLRKADRAALAMVLKHMKALHISDALLQLYMHTLKDRVQTQVSDALVASIAIAYDVSIEEAKESEKIVCTAKACLRGDPANLIDVIAKIEERKDRMHMLHGIIAAQEEIEVKSFGREEIGLSFLESLD